ncbi:unnamed protein product [Oppiella nova]|uniref:Uncharacterized protein n=1 Tax=Oppiella nova TaxID=334625 RepID=A0A7R9LZ45_9ACAR|nr:unnamed protein product [Oppiella nova]CAG2168109.1 unnamed protein product [Oppiella nova]
MTPGGPHQLSGSGVIAFHNLSAYFKCLLPIKILIKMVLDYKVRNLTVDKVEPNKHVSNAQGKLEELLTEITDVLTSGTMF